MPIRGRIKASHWQDWATLALGAWLFVSPWLLGYAGLASPAWNAWVMGVVIGLVSVAALVQFAEWEDWVNVVLGLWLVVSPWVMDFAQSAPTARWNALIVGLAVGGLALWDALSNRERLPA